MPSDLLMLLPASYLILEREPGLQWLALEHSAVEGIRWAVQHVVRVLAIQPALHTPAYIMVGIASEHMDYSL